MSYKNPDDHAGSCKSKIIDSKAVLLNIKASSVILSGKIGISSSVVDHFHNLSKSVDPEAVLKDVEANPVSSSQRVSGEQGISRVQCSWSPTPLQQKEPELLNRALMLLKFGKTFDLRE